MREGILMNYRPLTGDSEEHYRLRIEAVDADEAPRWGRMDAAAMFAHNRRYLEVALGAVPPGGKQKRWLKPLLLPLLTSRIPFPKRVRSFDILFPPDVKAAEMERAALLAMLRHFAAAHDEQPDRRTVHFLFGPLPLRSWAKLAGKHLEHHLRQFGV